jgi:hypothetical protein
MIEVDKLNTMHDEAMAIANLGLLARRKGHEDQAQLLFRQAFQLELEIAHIIAPTDLEPSRSIIHRSAATLALDCGEVRTAEKLIAAGLAGNPPEAIARELRELLRQVLEQMLPAR